VLNLSYMQGTHSGQPVKLYVHIKDSRGKRIKTGGDDVAVRVQVWFTCKCFKTAAQQLRCTTVQDVEFLLTCRSSACVDCRQLDLQPPT
jgi:hypothetical protein